MTGLVVQTLESRQTGVESFSASLAAQISHKPASSSSLTGRTRSPVGGPQPLVVEVRSISRSVLGIHNIGPEGTKYQEGIVGNEVLYWIPEKFWGITSETAVGVTLLGSWAGSI